MTDSKTRPQCRLLPVAGPHGHNIQSGTFRKGLDYGSSDFINGLISLYGFTMSGPAGRCWELREQELPEGDWSCSHSLGMVSCPGPLPPLPGQHVVNSLAPPWPPTMLPCLTLGLRQRSHPSADGSKLIFLSVGSLKYSVAVMKNSQTL